MTSPSGSQNSVLHLLKLLWRAAICLWLATLLAAAILWVDCRNRRRIFVAHPDNGRTLFVLESYAGQFHLLYGRLPDAQRVAFKLFLSDDCGEVVWNTGEQRYHRESISLLKEGRGSYAAWPFPVEGPVSVNVSKENLCLKLAFGRASDPYSQTGATRVQWVQLVLPNWLFFVLFGLIPAVFCVRRLVHWWRRQKYPPNCCRKCGYDLRATPAPTGPLLPRCPECGHLRATR